MLDRIYSNFTTFPLIAIVLMYTSCVMSQWRTGDMHPSWRSYNFLFGKLGDLGIYLFIFYFFYIGYTGQESDFSSACPKMSMKPFWHKQLEKQKALCFLFVFVFFVDLNIIFKHLNVKWFDCNNVRLGQVSFYIMYICIYKFLSYCRTTLVV